MDRSLETPRPSDGPDRVRRQRLSTFPESLAAAGDAEAPGVEPEALLDMLRPREERRT